MNSVGVPTRLVPKLVDTLRSHDRGTFAADFVSGVTVGLVALPLAMAFAIASGVPPQAGIYTAILAGLVVPVLGGSRCQVSGPTGAFVVVVAGIVAKFGMPGLLMCTMMAGAMLLLMGLTGLGSAVQFIPRSVVIGFTNGIGVLIASTQIKDFFGLTVSPVPGAFLRIHGPFLFGAAAKLDRVAADLPRFGPVVNVRLRNMTAVNSTGLHALETFAEFVLESGRSMLVCGARKQPAKMIRRSALHRIIGAANICPHITAALARAGELHTGRGPAGARAA